MNKQRTIDYLRAVVYTLKRPPLVASKIVSAGRSKRVGVDEFLGLTKSA